MLVTSDHTRAVPGRITLPLELAEIRADNLQADITVLITTGLHWATTETEQMRMFGDVIVDNERIEVSDAFDPSSLLTWAPCRPAQASRCTTSPPNATPICEGFIEPHFFAGFSGGRKSVLPGIDESFPARFFDLDRCFLVQRIAVEHGHDLMVVNSHMSAYDEGGVIRAQQMALIMGVLHEEAAKGNYVIAGGDWNRAPCDS